MMLNRFKKRLLELGESDFVSKVEADFKEKQQKYKKQKKIKTLTPNFHRIAFRLAYVGINYHGLESQINSKNTIEEHLFKGLVRIRMIDDRESCQYNRAGRTDKGVSALGNVVALNVRKVGRQDELHAEMLNRVLPEDIQVTDEALVDPNFNARYDCIKRVYKYYFYKMYYNLELFEQAMVLFKGEHDFRNFCKLDVVANQNFVRTIEQITLEEVFPDGAPRQTELFHHDDRLRLFCVTIEGNAFLWHQIRYMMASIFLVASGDENIELISNLLQKFDGKPNYQMAPEYPLVLYNCEFKTPVFRPTLETHTGLIQGIYETLREALSRKYIEFLHFQQLGAGLLKVPIAPPQKVEKNKKPLLEQKTGVTVQGAIENLKGKRKEKYEIKIQKVSEYQKKLHQSQQLQKNEVVQTDDQKLDEVPAQQSQLP